MDLDELETDSLAGLASGPLAESGDSRLSRIRKLEDRVLEQAMVNLDGVQRFSEITGLEEEPSEAWVAEVGLEQARHRLRCAKYGLMSAKEAPVGIKVDMAVMSGIMKVRAAEKTGPRVMNAVLVQMPVSGEPMKEIIVEMKE
jgi:hypothetical protein